jgi:hypothetical protein
MFFPNPILYPGFVKFVTNYPTILLLGFHPVIPSTTLPIFYPQVLPVNKLLAKSTPLPPISEPRVILPRLYKAGFDVANQVAVLPIAGPAPMARNGANSKARVLQSYCNPLFIGLFT